jgi:hypothetical protein
VGIDAIFAKKFFAFDGLGRQRFLQGSPESKEGMNPWKAKRASHFFIPATSARLEGISVRA